MKNRFTNKDIGLLEEIIEQEINTEGWFELSSDDHNENPTISMDDSA